MSAISRSHLRLLIRKEFLQLRRDPFLPRVIFLMPIMQLILMGYVVAADVTHLPTAVVDADRSAISRQITSSLEASGYFQVTERPNSEDALQPLMDSGEVGVAVVIPHGTADAIARGERAPVAVIVDGTDSQTAAVGSGNASALLAGINEQLVAASGAPGTAAVAGGSSGSGGGGPGITTSVQVLYNPTMKTINTMIPGLMAVIIMLSLLVVLSQAVVREREQGTLEQMFVTPIRPTEYLIGKVVPYVVLAVAQMLVVAVAGTLWFRVPFNGDLLVAGLGLFLLMIVSIGLGLLVSLVSSTRSQAIQTVLFLMLPSMVLCGFIFPVSSMPRSIAWVSEFIPLTHAIRVIRGTAVAGAGLSELAWPLIALTLFAVAIFGSAVALTSRRLAR